MLSQEYLRRALDADQGCCVPSWMESVEDPANDVAPTGEHTGLETG